MPEKFKPKPGQTDYTNARWAPVVNCIVRHGDKILIVKRSSDLRFYPGLWNGIGGFLDDEKSLEEKVKEELGEEIGLREEEIISIKLGEVFDFDDPAIGKTWVTHPVLVDAATDRVVLDWEAQEYKWVKPEELKNFETAAGFLRTVENFFNLKES
ncbi:MAG: NUDIX domain-containing protein [Patescibacteria group bacterium]